MPKRQRRKNPAAVALGRLGGLARGKIVRDIMPLAQRQALASHASRARWAQVRAKKAQARGDPDDNTP